MTEHRTPHTAHQFTPGTLSMILRVAEHRAGPTSTQADERPVLRAAVVGCGGIAHEHLAALQLLAPNVQVVGVADRSRAAASFVADRFGVESSFDRLDRLLSDTAPDVVHVLTPPSSHVELVKQCLDAGCHVVCEKPMAPSANEADEMLQYAVGANRMLIESQNLRFNDQVRRIDEEISSGRLGAVRCVDVNLALDLTAGPFGDENLARGGLGLPGGAVHDFLPHLVYLFEHFTDRQERGIDRACGTLANRSGNPRVGFDSLDAILELGSSRGFLRIASDVGPDAFRLTVRGEERSIETDFYNSYMRVEGGANVGKRAPLEQIASGIGLARSGLRNVRDKLAQHGPMHGLPLLLDHFYRAVESSGPAPVSPAQVAATARSTEVILESVRRSTGAATR